MAAFSHLPKRWRADHADAWTAKVQQFWIQRAVWPSMPSWMREYRNMVSNEEFAHLVRTLDDLRAALLILTTLRTYVNPDFLATRPSYMKQEGDQAELQRQDYYPVFEAVLENNPGIVLASGQEIRAVLEEFAERLPVLWATRFWFYSNLEFYSARMRRRQQVLSTAKRQQLKLGVIEQAMHPRRVERLLEIGGFEALENVFGVM